MRTYANIQIPIPKSDIQITVSLHLPDAHVPLASPSVVLIAAPGGGYSKEYFDLRLPGRSGYSEAEFHTARGIVVLAYDHLGVGQSTIPDPDTLSSIEIADANAAAIREAV